MSLLFPENKFNSLHDSIKWSNKQLNFTRKKRVESVKQFVGFHHVIDGSPKRVPVNLLALAVLVHVRLLAARAPQVMITSKIPELEYNAVNFSLAVNQLGEEINIEDTFHRLVMEAMFSMGIAKVGLHTVGTALGHKYGSPFVDVVTIDDYFCDMSAKHIDLIDYEGNDYWLDYDEIMESDWLDNSARDIKADDYSVNGPNGEQRANGITGGENPKVYKEKKWLRDVWLPSEKLLLTYAITDERVLKVTEWDGPESGPYPKLGFGDVPGNLLPLAPISLWLDLHETINSLYRKMKDGAEAQKRVSGFNGSDNEGVENFKNAKNGDGIKYTGPEPKTLESGGVDQKTFAFFLQSKDLFSYMATNLDSLGGLSPIAQTVGQEKLIGEAASTQIRDMADKTIKFIKKIYRSVAFYEWSDPIKTRTLKKQVPGTDITIPIQWGKDSRKGKISEYDLDIDVYSMQDDSPTIKLQKLKLFVDGFVIPMSSMIQQSNGIIDAEKIIKTAAKYSGLQENEEIVKWVDPAELSNENAQSTMLTNTTRTYERVGRPGMTGQGASSAMQQILMGGNPGGDIQSAATQ